MEDDDEFGDLYTDVLRPLTASFQSHSQGTDAAAAATNAAPSSSESRPIDLKINSDDEEILYGAPDSKNSNSSRCFNLNALVQEKPLHVPGGRPEQKVFNLNIGSNFEADSVESLGGNGGRHLDSQARFLEKVNFIEDEDDINIVVEERDGDDGLVEKDNNLIVDNNHDMYYSAAEKENTFNFVNESEVRPKQMIPGVSGRLENHGGSNFEEDWESEESEDDLQIVLNDNNHGAMGIERMPGFDGEDEEDIEQLVIVADNGDGGHHHHQPVMMEEQEWGGEEGGPGAGGERKELGDSNKTTAGAGSAAQAAVQPKIGYTNHAYQHPLHSQFKYVRPGAAPIPGAASVTPGGIPGLVRPPITMGPVAGRGRGDWRPGGIRGSTPMQKGFIPGYGVPVWGVNSAGRGYGSGLDFTLPSHKTIFEVDIDSFEDKPWKLPGIEISDFFNFGLNEDSWKDYCKQLELLRLEKTMQSKIRVYESGRAEQEYDRDLPPELAAAVSVQDIPFESANPGKVDSCSTEVARASANGRTPLPVGRPIPVEFGSGDRPPSVDSRRQRMHDIDAIIEVVCHNPMDDDDITEQQDNDPAGNDLGGGDEIDDLPQDDTEHIDRNSHVYNGRKRELDARRTQFEGSIKRESEDVLHFHTEVPVHHKPDGEIGITHEARLKKGRGRGNSPNMTANDNKREIMSHQNEESFTVGNGTQSPLSSSRAIGSDGEQNVSVRDDTNDESVIDDISFDEEREDKAVDETCMDTLEDGNLMDSTKNQKLSSRLEQLSQEDDDMEDSKAASSDNSKARSGSSKDHRKLRDSVEDEILQHGRPRSAGNSKRPVEDEDNASRKVPRGGEEIGRHHKSVKGRENSYPRRGEDHNSSLRRLVKSESADWRKESDISEGSWHRRGEDHHGRRIRVEDTRKMEHGGEFGSRNWGKVREGERSEKEHHQSRNQLDNGSWSAVNHKKNLGSRQRDWDDNHKSRNSKVDDLQSKKRKEEAYVSREHAAKDGISHNHRESSSRRKGVRDDGTDQWKRDDQARFRDDSVHYVRQKEDGLFQRERNDRQRERDEWRLKQTHEEILSRREKEDTQPMMRPGWVNEDKTWISHSRGKEDFRVSSREFHPNVVGRHRDQPKRRDRVENEKISKHRTTEDVYPHPNQLSHDEKRARYERPGSRNEHVPYASDTSRVHEHKQKESSRKGKDSEKGDHSSLVPSKRNQDENGSQKGQTGNLRDRTEQEIGENGIHMNHQYAKKLKEEPSSDEEHPDSRRGRSKLERWTSHKDKDFSITSISSSSLKSKDLDTFTNGKASLVTRLPEEPSKKVEDKSQSQPQRKPLLDDKDTVAEINNVNAKVMENKHLDTVAKLKKRSERFKLPMPGEKDSIVIKKMESEPLPSAKTEIPPDSEIKPERPARKRRWTGN